MQKGWQWAALMAMASLSGCDRSSGTAEPPGKPPRSDVRIELHEVRDRFGEGGVLKTGPGGTPVYLVGAPIVTTSAFSSIREAQDADGRAVINFTFTDSAAPRIQRATERMVGKQLAVTLDGEPISIAAVNGPFGKDMQTSNLAPGEARRLVHLMTETSPPPAREEEQSP